MTNTNAFSRRVCTLLLVALSTCVWSQEPVKPVLSGQFHHAEAIVEAINPATREVSLRGPLGPLSVVVSPDVKNLDKVHVGDKLVVSYYQGIAAQIVKGDLKVTAPGSSSLAYGAGAGRPAGGVITAITATVTIEAVEPGTHTVAFRNSDGSVHVVAVQSPNMQQFVRTLKRGDSVRLTYTESVAVRLVAAKG